jgi:hypothetical protein
LKEVVPTGIEPDRDARFSKGKRLKIRWGSDESAALVRIVERRGGDGRKDQFVDANKMVRAAG